MAQQIRVLAAIMRTRVKKILAPTLNSSQIPIIPAPRHPSGLLEHECVYMLTHK